MKKLAEILQPFNALNTRERVLAVLALLGVIYFIFDLALLRPRQAQGKVLRDRVQAQIVEIDVLTKTLQAVSAPVQGDPLAPQRAERDQLRVTYAQAESVIGRATSDARLGDVIRAMVASKPGLVLASIKTLPVETVVRGTASAPATVASVAASMMAAAAASAPASGRVATPQPPVAPMPDLYKHGIEVTINGSYPALVQYLKSLEGSAGAVFWGNVKLEVLTYPAATLRMTVYALSTRPDAVLG